MQFYTGFQYLLIDAANSFGLDKEVFSTRLEWAKENFEVLEELADQADDYYLYVKAVDSIRKAVRGEASGHLVGLDAICSGLQIMSAMTGCVKGAEATGIVDTGVRPDAYTECTTIMQRLIPWFTMEERKKVKNAVMTHFYGSYEEPVKEFGEGTEEHNAFLKSVPILAPAAAELREYLRDTWNPEALEHSWVLPDGFECHIKVMVEREARIEVDELGGATFTHYYEENAPQDSGVSNIANVIHSVDAYVVRCMERRCNYNPVIMDKARDLIIIELLKRQNGYNMTVGQTNDPIHNWREHYRRCEVPDVGICPLLDSTMTATLSTKHLDQLLHILDDMMEHDPFPVITVHDEFKCHPNNCNAMRWHYKEILADIADSKLIDDLMSQLYRQPMMYQKKSPNLGDKIRESEHGIC